MILLCLGLLMWAGVHFIPTLLIGLRTALVARIRLGPYKGLFALLIVGAVVLIVYGWKSVEPTPIYVPPAWGTYVTYAVVFAGSILFFSARLKTNIKRVLRHPQLTGLMLWSFGHLFSNGEDRSLVLFIGLGVWALLEMLLINRRVGAWVRPEPVPPSRDVMTLVVGMALFGLLIYLHAYLTGISLIGS